MVRKTMVITFTDNKVQLHAQQKYLKQKELSGNSRQNLT